MKKIQDETKLLYGYTDRYAPKFLSSRTDFRVVLMNLNFTPQDTPQDPLLEQGLLLRTIPDKPTSKFQKYITKQ